MAARRLQQANVSGRATAGRLSPLRQLVEQAQVRVGLFIKRVVIDLHTEALIGQYPDLQRPELPVPPALSDAAAAPVLPPPPSSPAATTASSSSATSPTPPTVPAPRPGYECAQPLALSPVLALAHSLSHSLTHSLSLSLSLSLYHSDL